MIPTNAVAGVRLVVLSAGFSARLGSPKALAGIRGVTLLRRTVRTVAPLAAARVIVVLPPRAVRARAELRGERVDVAVSSRRSQGLSASVRAGLFRARYSAAVLILPVDLPWLECREIARLIARWRLSRRSVVARRVGERAGLKNLVNGLPADELELLDVPSAALDVDTPEDLRLARRRLRGFKSGCRQGRCGG